MQSVRPRRVWLPVAVFVSALFATRLRAQDAAPPGPALQAAINQAVERGIEFLVQRQNRDGSWSCEFCHREPHHAVRGGQAALCVYTLLKSGLPATHSTVRRGLAYLLDSFPEHGYAISVELMALEAARDPALAARVQKLADALIELRVSKRGGWMYWSGPNPTLSDDLSNIQYAAFGLRSALRAGARLPRNVWPELAERVLDFQEVAQLKGKPRTGAAPDWESAGFGYVPPVNSISQELDHRPTGAMTAAGIATLAVCIAAMPGDAPLGLVKRCQAATGRGSAWLAENFTLSANPKGLPAWQYYYIYGIERVGALLELVKIGEHDWYREGAEFLVKAQAVDGGWATASTSTWPPMPLSLANTCFALLFLRKASATVTGETQVSPGAVYAAEAPEQAVWLRVTGRAKIRMLVSGFGADVLAARASFESAAAGLRVLEVQYLVDGELVQSVLGDPEHAWTEERYPAEHSFAGNGRHTVEARVKVLLPGADAGSNASAFELLSSGVIALEVAGVLEPWMLPYARSASVNLLAAAKLSLKASSRFDDKHEPEAAVDGLQFYGWACTSTDPAPKWTLELGKPVKADVLLLSPLGANPAEQGRWARVKTVRLSINGEARPLDVALDPDPLKKTEIKLAKAMLVKKIEIEIAAREPGEQGKAGGLAEVELRLAH